MLHRQHAFYTDRWISQHDREGHVDLEAIAHRVKKAPAEASSAVPVLWGLGDALDTNGEDAITSDQIVQVIAELE